MINFSYLTVSRLQELTCFEIPKRKCVFYKNDYTKE